MSTKQRKPGERLFEFYVERTKTCYRCELRDHGPTYGVEAQFFDPVELVIARRFDTRLDASRPSRELAIACGGPNPPFRTKTRRGPVFRAFFNAGSRKANR